MRGTTRSTGMAFKAKSNSARRWQGRTNVVTRGTGRGSGSAQKARIGSLTGSLRGPGI